MTANEYYRRFTDLSRYHPDIAANLVEMLRRFRLGTKKKWRFMATTTPCASYQEFYEILLRIEDSENMPSESEEEEKDGNQKKDDKAKVREEVVDFLGILDSRDKGILVEEGLRCVADLVDLSGTREDSPSKKRLLPVVQDLRGNLSGVRYDVIYIMRAKRLLSKGCQGYLAHVVLNDVASSSVEDVKVVRHFPNVFPDDLPGLSPDRDVKFTIDLLPVYSKSKSEHVRHLTLVLKRLREHQLYAKFSKCQVWLDQVAFLGHVISAQGILVDPQKVAAVENWEQPRTVMEKDLNLWHWRWIELLSDYDCMIEYHPGRANVVADALRRKTPVRLNALYASRIPLLAELRSIGVRLGVED
ncbi:uncharacterized protein [Pyrus communis]|uniref:uncharacterized protein n=1 Tax=Pyrus communis TaxID=23211 RepID=UPI0035C22C5F